MPRISLMRLVLALALGALVVAAFGRSAQASPDPLDPKAIPDPLKAWTAWALDGKDDALCPTFFAQADQSSCVWPSRLELVLDEHGGRFTQKWHLDAKRWVRLAGDEKRWPNDVKVDGARAVVIDHGAGPTVQLGTGDHTVQGIFAWDSLPESLAVPKETGLFALSVRGTQVASPNRDAQGTVWLQKTPTNEEGDALEFVVHRKVIDDIPLLLVTRIELHAAGKNREELLGKALYPGFIPMALDSPLPARLEPDGRLRVQVRPGVFTIELTVRSDGVVRSLTRPAADGPWRDGDEVWVFEAKNDYRIVTVEGVPSMDPQQTTLPDAWKSLPAYPMKVGATLNLVERRRGDADPPPNQLALVRQLWLDFDGSGYAVSDNISGTLNRDSRLSMQPPTVLGRVSIGGRDQFITHLGDAAKTGVEIRQGELVVNADSRIPGDPSDIPAVGWAHDFHQVQGALHLPPGWRLVHASGVDEVPGTWVRHWSLLELFLGLIAAIGIWRLYGVRWGAVALVMLVLTLPEEDAPKWSWLVVLATEALVRVLPGGRIKKLFEGARLAAILIVTLVAVPFLVEHVRQGMYPALANESAVVGSGSDSWKGTDGESAGIVDMVRGGDTLQAQTMPPSPPTTPTPSAQAGQGAAGPLEHDKQSPADENNKLEGAEKRADAPPPTGTALRLGGLAKSRIGYTPENAQAYDPSAVVQTGPGLPRWRWATLDLKWSGPVASTQRLHLYLLSPFANLILALLRAALLAVLVLRLFPWATRLLPRGWAVTAGALFLLALPATARADVPGKEMLEELKDRLLRKPECSPNCASSGRMAIEVRGGALRARMEVDATAPTAVPLPGASAQWSPTQVLVDGQPAKGVLRADDGVVWVELGAGSHQVFVDGPMADRESMQLALHMKPHHVEVTSTGWTVAGLHEDGLADDNLEFTRIRKEEEGGAGASLQPGTLPPFVRVERTLEIGLNWQVDTKVVRVTRPGTAVVLEVPLLTGESVTTADVRVEGGKALVNMGPQTTEASWHSVLEQKSPVTLAAPKSVAWTEVWRMDVGPIWHASYSGIPFVHTQPVGGVRVPEWRPWPGEEAKVEVVRPFGVPGQTLTIDESSTDVRPGLRATDVTLTLSVRSSRGAEHTITLPPDAQLESLTINNATQPIRQDGRRVTVPVVPGAQRIVLIWRETPGVTSIFSTPAIDLGAPNVNASTTVQVPGGLWLLLAGGPRVGPAVLFWSLLLVLLVVSLALGSNRWTPLRSWHWLLLAIGLSQVSVVLFAIFVGWLIALGWRARNPGERLRATAFNLRQVLLVVWTMVALGILCGSLVQGLLGSPEMQVRGNGSSSAVLRWFTDRSEATLPGAWMVSVPILVYRGAMLAWALWIAWALLGWLRWAWVAFTTGGGWRKPPPRPLPIMAPLGPEVPGYPPAVSPMQPGVPPAGGMPPR
jgi:hypothetical protein